MIRIDVIPKPYLRLTQRSTWADPRVRAYNAWRDDVRKQWSMYGDNRLLERGELCARFDMPMPASWSKKKRGEMCGSPHQCRPDSNNLSKALEDALFWLPKGDKRLARMAGERTEDAHIWLSATMKLWAEKGSIWVMSLEEFVAGYNEVSR